MKASRFLIFFGVAWSGMTLLFDGFTIGATIRQAAALRYPSTEGTVLTSEVTEDDSDEGKTYNVKIRYSYSVGSQEYQNERYRYQTISMGSKRANAIVQAHPVESAVRVYYNARSPQDSLLSPGVTGGDLFLVAFMTPFNAVMLAFWSAGLSHLRLWKFKPKAGGLKVITHLRNTTVRLTPISPVATAIASAALAAFGSIFIVGFGSGGFHPPLQTMLVTWTVIIAFGITGGIWHGVKVISGKYDLIIDEMGGSLELPLTQGRKERRRIPFANIENVYVATIEKNSNDGDGKTSSYVPTLSVREGGGLVTERLVECYSVAKANAFVDWLREELPVKELSLARDQKPPAAQKP